MLNRERNLPATSSRFVHGDLLLFRAAYSPADKTGQVAARLSGEEDIWRKPEWMRRTQHFQQGDKGHGKQQRQA